MKTRLRFFLWITAIPFSLLSCNIYNLNKYSNQEKYTYNSTPNKFKFEDNQILIPTSISGKKNLDFIFDLGAGGSVIFLDSLYSDVLTRHKPIAAPAKVVSADGKKVKLNYYRTGDIRTEMFSVENSFILAINRESSNACKKLNGMWGASSFAPAAKGKKNKVILINMQDTTLAILNTLPELNNWIEVESKYSILQTMFYIKLHVENEPLEFLFDTGFSGSILLSPTDYEKCIGNTHQTLSLKKTYGEIAHTLTGIQNDTAYSFVSSVSINDSLKADSVSFISLRSIKHNIMGMDFIRRFNILVDYQNNKIYLNPNVNFQQQSVSFFKAKGFGPRYSNRQKFSIAALMVDSPAENAGLKIGDEIISINGLRVDSVDICEIDNLFKDLDSTSPNNEIIVKRGDEILKFIL